MLCGGEINEMPSNIFVIPYFFTFCVSPHFSSTLNTITGLPCEAQPHAGTECIFSKFSAHRAIQAG